MKINLPKILFISILIQIISTQGILTFNLFKLFGNWELKSIVHPIGLFVIFLYFGLKIIKKNTIKITPIDLFFFTYLSVLSFFLMFNSGSMESIYLAFREVFLVFILIFIYNQSYLTKEMWRKILKIVYILVLLNLFFTALTYILGPEKYMKLLTGKYVWGNDPLYKFKISSFYTLFWRSPGLIGESASVGFFGLISYFLFLKDEKYKNKKFFALILTVICFTRSVYLALILFLFLKFILKKRTIDKLKIWIPYLPYIPIVLLFLIWPLYNSNLLSSESFFMRIDHWVNNISMKFNWFFGGAIGKVGGAARGEGVIATIDSYWFLILMSTGVLGISLIIIYLYEKSLGNQQLKIILIGFFFACFFVTITQSMSFLVLFPLLFLEKPDILPTDYKQPL